jgi:YrbI family 3-deoxy-D-manno-octulosonate 8-phosphate phosphatase
MNKKISLLLLDVDGVQTDGGLYYSDDGGEFKKFNVRDGIAIKRAIALGVEVAIISHSLNNRMIEQRCRTLGITRIYVGLRDKLEVYDEWLDELNVRVEETAFIGDDVNDHKIMKRVGLSACPSDAVPAIKGIASVVLKARGGAGVVREFVDMFIMSDEEWLESVK